MDGDAQALAAGHPAMQNPSAAEVAAVLADARVQAADMPRAGRLYDEAQAAIAALRPRADELIAEVMADLRYTLRKQDEPGQRRVMASYGATFKSLPGEPVDPTPTPAPAAGSATSTAADTPPGSA